MEATEIRRLEEIARTLRRDIVTMIGVGHAGHLGGSCSLADIITCLYFYRMRHNPRNPREKDRDRCILSKGHAAIVQYVALLESGYLDKETYIHTLKKLGTKLQGHPDMRKFPGIEANTGSLGQGVSLAAGMAAGMRLNRDRGKVYVIVGDGELAEGQIWESLMGIVNFQLQNLVVIVDQNGIQATGRCEERYRIDHLPERFRAFGFDVQEIDGHDMEAILSALAYTDEKHERPCLILAHTVKGKGIPFAENTAAFHNGILSEVQYADALAALA